MREPMDSPFFSQRQTAGFALVLLFFLALPLILAKSGALSRRDVYETVPVKWGWPLPCARLPDCGACCGFET